LNPAKRFFGRNCSSIVTVFSAIDATAATPNKAAIVMVDEAGATAVKVVPPLAGPRKVQRTAVRLAGEKVPRPHPGGGDSAAGNGQRV
jgi:hypothetical protein